MYENGKINEKEKNKINKWKKIQKYNERIKI